MKSNELFQEFFKRHGVKRIAARLGRAGSSLYKWTHQDGGQASGGLNPLERLLALIHCTGDLQPLHWLCEKCGGFFVKNPVPETAPVSLLVAENEMNHEQAEFTAVVTAAAKKGSITQADADEISARWERVKQTTESFVQACQRGVFRCGVLFLSLGWWFATGEVLVAETV